MTSYIAINNDLNIRKQSSSGGIFSALATYVLRNQGIVFGAAWNKDWLVDMISINSLENLPKIMGSKYLQANINNTYQECQDFLGAGKLVLYSGLPCQLHGLKKFLNKDYENLYLVDIACHGLMPINIWKDYLKSIQRPDAQIISINFRVKDPDWNNYSVEIKYSDNKILKEPHQKNKYIKAFLSDKYLKSSCYNCKFKNTYSISDLIIGDAWGIKNNWDTKNGISFIKTYTQKGHAFLVKIKDLKIIPYNYANMPNGCLFNIINTKPETYNPSIFKKRVAIITLHLFNNIGGILQAFALNKLITEAGYNSEVITKKDNRLLSFAKKNINLRLINSATDITKIKENEYDIYVVGSDQIWRKKYTTGEFNKDYINIPFLYFTNNWNKTRLSYAASLGVTTNTWEYNKDEAEKIEQLLRNFNALSVREVQSIDDCKQFFGTSVLQCLDPTLLIDKECYLNLCKDVPTIDKDLFIYLLDETPEKLTKIHTFCDSKNLSYFKASSSVESWLAAFRDAKYVFTDSFHGCIFALLFNKPFICLYNKNRGNARFDSLISLFGLTNIIYNIEQLDTASFNNLNIDFKSLSNSSKLYLENSLALPGTYMHLNLEQPLKTTQETKKPKNNYLYF